VKQSRKLLKFILLGSRISDRNLIRNLVGTVSDWSNQQDRPYREIMRSFGKSKAQDRQSWRRVDLRMEAFDVFFIGMVSAGDISFLAWGLRHWVVGHGSESS